MRIGLGIAEGGRGLSSLVERIQGAEELGFASAWVPQVFSADAMTACALAGAVTRRIEVATAVVPTFSRHPFHCAQQALSTQVALSGRFALGLGPSHQVVIEGMFGLSYDRPARHVREYVTVVQRLLVERKVDFEGEAYRVRASLGLPCDAPPPLLIGALGPRMRRIAGELCDGTITWMAGPRTLGEEVGPGVRAAARAAGRPAPRVVAGVPVALTDDADGARRFAGEAFARYRQLPSYRAMLELEGAADPSDIALVGDERAIEEGLSRYASAGVTDFNAAVFPYGSDSRAAVERTTRFLAELAARP